MVDVDLPAIPVRERSVVSCALVVYTDPVLFESERVASRYAVFGVERYVSINGDLRLESDLPVLARVVMTYAPDAETAPLQDVVHTYPPDARWIADSRSFATDALSNVHEWYPSAGTTLIRVDGTALHYSTEDSVPMFGYYSDGGWVDADALGMSSLANASGAIEYGEDGAAVLVVGSFDKDVANGYELLALDGAGRRTALLVSPDGRLVLTSDGGNVGSAYNVFMPGTVSGAVLSVGAEGAGFRALNAITKFGASSGFTGIAIEAPQDGWVGSPPTSFTVSCGSDSDIELLEVALWMGPGASSMAARALVETLNYYRAAGAE